MELAHTPSLSRSGGDKTLRPISPPRAQSHSSRHSQRRQPSKRGRHIRSLQLVNLLLVVALVVVFIGWINTWVNYNNAEDERVVLAAQLRQTSEELEKMRIRASELNANVSTLAQQRLPGLRELRFDTTLPIDKDYVRNISFTRTGVGQKGQYEYSLVLENRSRDILKPNIRILLFDERGLQTGAAEITPKAATSNSDLEFLEPAEIRAYTAGIPSNRNDTPEYFLIIVE